MQARVEGHLRGCEAHDGWRGGACEGDVTGGAWQPVTHACSQRDRWSPIELTVPRLLGCRLGGHPAPPPIVCCGAVIGRRAHQSPASRQLLAVNGVGGGPDQLTCTKRSGHVRAVRRSPTRTRRCCKRWRRNLQGRTRATSMRGPAARPAGLTAPVAAAASPTPRTRTCEAGGVAASGAEGCQHPVQQQRLQAYHKQREALLHEQAQEARVAAWQQKAVSGAEGQ